MKFFGEIAERLRRSTVQVLGSEDDGRGSGIVWNATGLILTNAHVVRGGEVQVELWNGTRLPAKTLKHDTRRDLAALQVAAPGLLPASIGDSTLLRPGELAIAVGNPLGFAGAVSTGVIQAVAEFAGRGWVQSNVRLAPGNSGGPLANARGEVIGVNTMIVSAGAGRNLALAIPSASAQRFLNQAEEAGIGVTARPVALKKENAFGFLILEARPGSPADRASLLIGDLLVGVNGRCFRSLSGLDYAIETAGSTLTVQFRRGGSQNRTVTIQLRQPDAAAA